MPDRPPALHRSDPASFVTSLGRSRSPYARLSRTQTSAGRAVPVPAAIERRDDAELAMCRILGVGRPTDRRPPARRLLSWGVGRGRIGEEGPRMPSSPPFSSAREGRRWALPHNLRMRRDDPYRGIVRLRGSSRRWALLHEAFPGSSMGLQWYSRAACPNPDASGTSIALRPAMPHRHRGMEAVMGRQPGFWRVEDRPAETSTGGDRLGTLHAVVDPDRFRSIPERAAGRPRAGP